MRVAFCTLGCKVNQYETQALEQFLRARGHEIVPFEDTADAYVVNSCTVTAVSDKKSRQAVRQARRRAPEAVVALCGCYPQTHPKEAEGLPADLIAGTGDRAGFVEALERTVRERKREVSLDDALRRRAFEPLPPGGLEGRTRCMLKVEDGCANFCTYCIIPYARGPVRSLPLEDAAAQAARMAAEGYREIVLTGIEISSWGRDLKNGQSLIDLIETVCAAAPGCRVRLGSLEPRTVTEEFASRAAKLDNLCPHFHLSLQSGCDATLKRMGRRYDAARFEESVGLLRGALDDPGLTADLIVGFPGETEAEFGETMEFIRRCAFSAMHIFPYSRRPGTPAASMPDQTPKAVKEERARLAAQAAARMEREFLARRVGTTVPVLFEEERDGLWWGYTARYCKVGVRSEKESLHNQLWRVRIAAAEQGFLLGEILNLENQ